MKKQGKSKDSMEKYDQKAAAESHLTLALLNFNMTVGVCLGIYHP